MSSAWFCLRFLTIKTAAMMRATSAMLPTTIPTIAPVERAEAAELPLSLFALVVAGATESEVVDEEDEDLDEDGANGSAVVGELDDEDPVEQEPELSTAHS